MISQMKRTKSAVLKMVGGREVDGIDISTQHSRGKKQLIINMYRDQLEVRTRRYKQVIGGAGQEDVNNFSKSSYVDDNNRRCVYGVCHVPGKVVST